MQIKYLCEKCNIFFDTLKVAKEHELSHMLEDAQKKFGSNVIVCPKCNGEGTIDGTDGCDIYTCPICNGKKIGKKRLVTKEVFEPI